MAAVALAAAQWVAAAVTAVGTSAGLSLAAADLAAGVAGALTIAGVTAGEIWAVGEVSSLLNPPPKLNTGGSPVDWKADPQAPVPYVIGRTGTSGNIVFADVAGDKNKYITYATVLSLGPVKSIGGFKANDVLTAFTSDRGEGAGTGQQTTTLAAAVSSGATVLQVANTAGFLKGQAITVGGQAATIADVYAAANEIALTGGLGSAAAQGAAIVGPSTTSFYQNRMWWKASLGVRPQTSALAWTATGTKDTPADHSGQPSTWGSSAKLSGLAHTLWTLEFATETYTTGTPKPTQVVEGVFCYDPRLDSTYPGGSGACRANDETTWVYSENPYIHGLTWLIGRSANGVRTMGVHAPLSAIDVAAFVAGANVADANEWTIGGVVSSTDGKWDVLKAMLIAGAGAPVKRGAMISCIVSAPQTSLDTLTAAEVVGDVSVPGTASRRTRINAIWPRYREEAQDFQIVPTDAPITVPAYATTDGGQRTREVEYSLVQDADQVGTLARYDIENAREIGPIVLPCKPRWMGYRPGDCITVNEPEYGLNNQKVVIINRNVDPATMITTLTVRTETDAKHAFALAETASPPPTPALTSVDPTTVAAPTSPNWTATGGTLSSSTGSIPCITVVGSCPDPNVTGVVFGYRPNSTGSTVSKFNEVAIDSSGATITQVITGLAPGAGYIPVIQYRSARDVLSTPIELAAVTTGGNVASDTNKVGGTASADVLASIVSAATDADNAAIAMIGGIIATENERAQRLVDSYLPDGTSAKIAIQNLASTVTANNTTTLQTFSLLGARTPDGLGFALDTTKITVAPGLTLATRFSKLDARSVTRANLIPNGDLSQGASGLTLVGFAFQNEWNGPRLSYNGSGVPQATWPKFVTTPGATLTFGATKTDNRAAQPVYLQSRWYKADGTPSAVTPFGSSTTTLNSEGRLVLTDTAPSDAKYGAAYFSAGGSDTGYVDLTNITAVLGTVDVPNAPPVATVQSLNAQIQSLTTATTDLTNGTSLASQITTLTAEVEGSGGTPSLSSRISALSYASTDLTNGSSLASQLTTLQAQVVSTPNLIKNGDFADGLKYFNAEHGSSVPGYSSQVGSYLAIGGTTADAYATSDSYPCNPGDSISIGFDGDCGLDVTAGIPYVFVQWLPSYATGALAAVNVNRDWRHRNSAPEQAAPGGTTGFRLVAVKPASATASTFYVSRIKVNYGAPSAWSDEKTQSTIAASVTETATAIADLSGNVEAFYGFKLNADGKVIGMRAVDDGPGGAPDVIEFYGDAVIVDGDLIVNGTITGPKLGTAAVGSEWHSEYNPTYTSGGVTYQVSGLHNLSASGTSQEFAYISGAFSGNTLEIEVYLEGSAGAMAPFCIILDGTVSSGAVSGGTNLTGSIGFGNGGAVRYLSTTNSGSPSPFYAGRYKLFYAPSAGTHRLSLVLLQGDASTYVGRRWIHVRDYQASVGKTTSSTPYG